MFFMYGLTSRGASVWPKKILPTALKVSAPLVPNALATPLAITFTTT